MAEYLAPGVYVEEVDRGPKPIEGVSTSTAGMFGVTERGPVNVPILVTSIAEFMRWFGERLNILEFSNANGPHCYLPHAVEGFFINGGKRLFIVRVLDIEAAVHAANFLFDRGTATSADSFILRAASELSGTAANPPLLYVVDPTAFNVNDWIRIGDGSSAEYRQISVIGAPANNTHIPLDSPLSRSHATGETIEEFTNTFDGAYTAPGFTIVLPPNTATTQKGDQSIVITGLQADINTLVGVPNQLIEIGGVNVGEYRFVRSVTLTAANEARIQLDSALLRMYGAGVAVRPLQITPLATTTTLGTPSSAGESMIYAFNRQGQFDTHNNLIILNSGTPLQSEVRRIGELGILTFSTGAYEDYPAGTLVEPLGTTLIDDDRQLTLAAAAGDISIDVDDITSLSIGQLVQIGAAADPNKEPNPQTIQNITPDPNPANAPAGTLDLTSALTNAHVVGVPVIPQPKNLTAAAAPGGSVIALNNRLGIAVNDILRIGSTPDDEFVVVQSIPNPSPGGIAPNAGNIVLSHPLNRNHATGTEVRRQQFPVNAGLQTTTLPLTTQSGTTDIVVTDSNGYAAGMFVRLTIPSTEFYYHRLTAAAAITTAAEVELLTALQNPHAVGSVLIGRDPMMQVRALDAGAWGNRIRISIEDEQPGLVSRTTLRTIIDPTHIRLASAAGVEAGTILEFLDPLNNNAVVSDLLKVVSVDRATDFTITFAGAGLTAAHQAAEVAANGAGMHLGVRSKEFHMTVLLLRQPDPSIPSRNEIVIDREDFRYLSMDSRHSRYVHKIVGDILGPLRLYDRRLEGESRYVRIHDLAQDLPEPARTNTLESIRLGPEPLVDILPDGRVRPARQELENGNDSIGTLIDDMYIGTDAPEPENRTGLESLRNIEEISIIACPGRTTVPIHNALINQCELMRYRFAVLDGPRPPADSLADVQNMRQQFDTKYAAIYHPWLLIPDPFPLNINKIADYSVPPSGHLLGVYARTDIERGVHKSPANEVVRGVLGLQRILNKSEQDILNPTPVNINVIRDFRVNNRGIRVWGGRVITSDSEWKYVNVRRLLIFIERSIDLGLQWVVFEPNAEPLWARVRRTISDFLTVVWRNGALEGTKREEAYFVKCDRTTMTQLDIDNGRLICLIGVAPVKPAEFVIIRIGLWTAHAEE